MSSPPSLMPGLQRWGLLMCACVQSGMVVHGSDNVAGKNRLTSLSYNDCQRHGSSPTPPDPGTLPSWSGDPAEFFDDYRPLKDVNRFVDHLQATHPDLVALREIGKSWQGRPLRVVEISLGGSREDKPCIFLTGGIHAREWLAVSTVLQLASEVLHRVGSEAEAGAGPVSSALQQFTLSFLAPANPDGYVYSWEADRQWRKTRSNRTGETCGSNADGVAGVDANRNWGYTRGETENPYYRNELGLPCAQDFMGPSAFSEPETKAISGYMLQKQKRAWSHSITDASGKIVIGGGYVAAFLDFHSFGMQLLPPWSVTGQWPPSPDKEYIQKLTNSMVAAINGVLGRNYKGAPDLLAPDPGTAPDWALGRLGVRATMTIEVEGGPSYTNQDYQFCAPKEYIKPTGMEQWAGLFALLHHIQTYGGEPSKLFGIGVASTTPPPPVSPCAISKKYSGMTSLSWAKHPSRMPALAFALGFILLIGLLAFLVRGMQIRRRQITNSDVAVELELEQAAE